MPRIALRDSQEVVAALKRVGLLAHTPGYIFPDPTVIGRQTILESIQLASRNHPTLDPRDDPQCWMVPGAPWITSSFGETPMAAMPFPTIDPLYASAMEGVGDLAIVLSDRPEVRAVMRAWRARLGDCHGCRPTAPSFRPTRVLTLAPTPIRAIELERSPYAARSRPEPFDSTRRINSRRR